MAPEEAKILKEKGNQFYKQEKFEEALKCYCEASALQPEDPVYYSNISAVHYETGKYGDSLKSIDQALTHITSSKEHAQLSSRLLLRKAKALLYTNKLEASRKVEEELSCLCQKEGVASPDADGFIAKALRNPKPSPLSFSVKPFMSRPVVDTRASEYFMVGHDYPQSALTGPLPKPIPTEVDTIAFNFELSAEERREAVLKVRNTAPMRIDLRNPQDNMFAFFYGGIGDARHLFTSMLDLLDSTDEIAPSTRFHFTLVDIKAAVIARDLILFYILKHIADIPPSDRLNNLEGIELLSLIHFTYIGAVMPAYLHDRLLHIIRELISDLENNYLPIWLSVENVPPILEYLNDWLDIKMTAKQFLSMASTGLDKGLTAGLISQPGLHVPEKVHERMNQVVDYADNITDEDLEKNFPSLEGNTAAEKRESFRKKMQDSEIQAAMQYSADSVPNTEAESSIFSMLNVLCLPEILSERHPGYHELLKYKKKLSKLGREINSGKKKEEVGENEGEKEGENGGEKEGENGGKKENEPGENEGEKGGEKAQEKKFATVADAKEAALQDINKNWEPNPTFWDKGWAEVMGELFYRLDFSPFTAAGVVYGTEYLLPPEERYFIYDYSNLFWSKVADSLSKFSQVIKLEFVVGDVYDLSTTIIQTEETRKEKGYPTKFDRIFLSNIPDYTGGIIPIAMFTAPILKRVPYAYVAYNILLNRGVFEDLEEQVRTYSLLPSIADHERFLGMKHIDGGLWGEDPKWIALDCPLPLDKLAKQDELTDWLYRIFLYMVLPPRASHMHTFRVDHPLNLIAFVNLFKWLSHVGFPHHWLSGILESILSGKIKTKARPPPNSMNFKFSAATISTKPFLDELHFALASNYDILPFPLLSPLPSSYVQYSLRMPVSPMYELRSPVLTLLFCPKSDIAVDSTNNNVRAMQQLCDKIINGNPNVSLVSTIRWDYETNKFHFWLPKERMEEMRKEDWYVVCMRLDIYRATSRPVSVKEAKE